MPGQNATLRSTGSMDDPFSVWYLDGMTANDMADQVAVAIFSRGPTYNSQPPSSPDDIQIELACVQAPGGSATGD